MIVEQFNSLVSQYASKLFAVAYRLTGDRQRAEDIVQETFVSAWKSPCYKQVETDIGRSYSWLLKIMRRRWYDYLRRKDNVIYLDELNVATEHIHEIDTSEISSELQTALNQLKPEFKETFLLVVVGELTHQETADLLKVPLGTVLSRIARTRKYLRKELMEGKRTVSSPSGKRVPVRVAGSTPVPSAL